MYLNVIPSDKCALNHIKIPKPLMKILNVDYGDWLVFNVGDGYYSVMATKASMSDIIEHGENKAFVNKDSPILFSSHTEAYIEPHQLTIGGDPEFFLINSQGRLVDASKIFPHEAQIGSDGDLGELRPDYALCPEQFVENIRVLMGGMSRRLPAGITPVASSYLKGRCCGFHVHLGMPIELLSYAADDTDRFLKNIVSTLDYLVALPAAVIDTDNSRRLSYLSNPIDAYGKLSDYRLNMRTLEYRTVGGFHLKSPEYAKSILSASFEVVNWIIKKTEEISGGWGEMSQVANFSCLKSRLNIPNRYMVEKIYTSKNRNALEEEAKKASAILKSIAEEYSDNIVTSSKPNNNLLSEWLTNEKECKANICKEKQCPSAYSSRS